MKRKAGADILQDSVVIIIVMIVLFSGLMFFVHKSSTGAVVYEELYAKQISLILGKAEPDSDIFLDFEKGFEIAEKNKINDFDGLVDIQDNKVFVKLSHRGNYSSYYFSDYLIDLKVIEERKGILISVREN